MTPKTRLHKLEQTARKRRGKQQIYFIDGIDYPGELLEKRKAEIYAEARAAGIPDDDIVIVCFVEQPEQGAE